MQEISRTGRIKGFLASRKKQLTPTFIDTSSIVAAKQNASLSPGSANSPSTPVCGEASPNTQVSMLRLALSNVELHKMLSEFAQKEFKYECVLIWDNIQRYKRANELEIRIDVARFIYDTFMREGEFGTSIRDSISQHIDQSSLPDGIFDELERDMETSLQAVFSKFSQTKAYQDVTNQGTNQPSINRQTLMQRPSLSKLKMDKGMTFLSIDIQREMSPTVGSSERFVGSPSPVTSPMLLSICKSPITINSPNVGDTPRFVGSYVEDEVISVPSTPPKISKENENHKRTASPRDFIASLLSFKKRKL